MHENDKLHEKGSADSAWNVQDYHPLSLSLIPSFKRCNLNLIRVSRDRCEKKNIRADGGQIEPDLRSLEPGSASGPLGRHLTFRAVVRV